MSEYLQFSDFGIQVNNASKPGVSIQEKFLEFLQTWEGTPALQSQWMMIIDQFPTQLLNQIEMKKWETVGATHTGKDLNNIWNIDSAVELSTSRNKQVAVGCVYASSISTPYESVDTKIETNQINNGLLGGVIQNNRMPYDLIKSSFIETNVSFVDLVVRPWIILMSHYGIVARPKINLKTDITIIHLNRSLPGKAMVPRKVWKLYDAYPASCDGSSSSQLVTEGSSIQEIAVSWRFTHYHVISTLFNTKTT